MRTLEVFLFTALAFVWAAPAAAATSSIPFTIENPDPADQGGHLSSIELDAQGSPHIAYTLATGELRYAEKNGADWVWEDLPQGVDVSSVDLALDPNGEPWIAFHASETVGIGVYSRVKVAHRAGGEWIVDTIGDTDFSLTGAAIAFDPAGVAHVAWGNFSRGFRVYYASWDLSGWSSEIVYQASTGDGDFGLAFDAQGVPHVVASTFDGILHAVFVSPGWTSELRPQGWLPSLALDSNGQPHIATVRALVSLPLTLEYEWRGTDGLWHNEVLGPVNGNFPPGPSLRLNQDDRPLIAFTDPEHGSLKLLRKPEDAWISDTVDTGGVGLYPSLVLAGGAHPRISYSKAGLGLHYAAGNIPAEPGETLPARAFTAGGSLTVALAGSSRADLCIRLEPVDGSFNVEDLDPTSIVMLSERTGTVSEISASESKRSILADRDHNGILELDACFARDDLASLFSSLEGRTKVAVEIEGLLRSGERVRAPFEVTVLLPEGLAARIYPNPLNPAGRLSFTLRRSGPLRAMLFDVAGRMVRVLADEARAEQGSRTIVLDGRDEQGRPLATGVYFYRVESSGDVLTGRIAIRK